MENLKNNGPEVQPKSPEELEIATARDSFFVARKALKEIEGKNNPEEEHLKDQLMHAEINYSEIKKKIVSSFLSAGPEGQEKASEFLLNEVEQKRKFDLDNKLVGRTERLISGVSKGIEKWDNYGKEEWKSWKDLDSWKGYAKRFTKTAASLAMIGVTSGLSIEGLSKIAGTTTASLSGGLTSYLGRRVVMGSAISALMAKIPDNKKKWVQRTLVAGSVGLAVASGAFIAGGAIVASSALGLGLAKLMKKRIKEGTGEKLDGGMTDVKEKEIDQDFLEEDITEMEQEMEKALKRADKEKIIVKTMEGLMAYIGGTTALFTVEIGHEISQHNANENYDEQSDDSETTTQKDVSQQEHTTTEDNSQTQTEEVKTAEQIKLDDIKHIQELQAKMQQEARSLNDATVHQGEGIENTFIRQIEHNPELAKSLGYKEGTDLHQFAGSAAHRLALEHKYVDDSGEIKITEGGKTAFQLKIEDGKVVVEEKTIGGGNVEDFKSREEVLKTQPEAPIIKPIQVPNVESAQVPETELKIKPDIMPDAKITPEPVLAPKPTAEDLTAILHAKYPQSAPINEYGHKPETQINTTQQATADIYKNDMMPVKSEIAQSINLDSVAFVKAHPEFVLNNPFHLSPQQLTETYDVHQKNMDFLVTHDSVGRNWGDILVHQKAKDFLEADIVKEGENIGPVIAYAHKLQTESGLKPEEGFLRMGKAETFEHFEARALQKIADDGNLDKIRLHDETPTPVPKSPDFQQTQQINSLEETPNFQDVYQGSIDKVFPEHTALRWFNHGSILVKDVISLENPGQLSNLSNYLKQLQTVTGLDPKTGEDAFHYVHRAIAEAEKQNKLEEARFK